MPKKKSKKSLWAEEEAAMPPTPPPPPPCLLNDDRLETSPYTSSIATLFFGQGQVEYRVPTALLPPSIAPTGPYYGPTFRLCDVEEDIAHTVVYFLHTGKYQTLRTYDMYLYERHAKEHKRALSVYVAAKKYGLDSLEALAREKVCEVDPSLPRVEVLKHLEVASGELPSDDDWLAGYLQSTLQEMFHSAGAASNWMDFNQIDSRFARVVLKGAAGIFASSEAARSNQEKTIHDGERYQMPLAPDHYDTDSQHTRSLDGSQSEGSSHDASSPKSTLTFSVVSGDEDKDEDVESGTDEDEPAEEPQKVEESWYDAPAEDKPAEEIPTTEAPAAFVDEAFARPCEPEPEAPPPEPVPYEVPEPPSPAPEPPMPVPEEYYPPPPAPLEPAPEPEAYYQGKVSGIEPGPPVPDEAPQTPPPEPIPVPAVDRFFDWPPVVPSKKSKRRKNARVYEEALMDVPRPPSLPLCPPPPPCPPEEVWQPVQRGCPGITEHLASQEWKDCSTCRSVVLMVARLASNSIHDDIEEA